MTNEDDFLRDTSGEIMAAFADASLAGAATYQAPDGSPAVPCTVMFTQGDAVKDDGIKLKYGALTTIELLRSEVPNPVKGARVIRAGVAWILDERIYENYGQTAGSSRWAVVHDRA